MVVVIVMSYHIQPFYYSGIDQYRTHEGWEVITLLMMSNVMEDDDDDDTCVERGT